MATFPKLAEHPRKAGRPRVPDTARAVSRTLTLPAAVWAALDTAAERAGTTPSKVAANRLAGTEKKSNKIRCVTLKVE